MNLWSTFPWEERYPLLHWCIEHNLSRAAINELFRYRTCNRQQLHFIPNIIQKVERNVQLNRHRLMVLGQSVLKSFGQSKRLSQWWFYLFLLPQSCWMHWVRRATACVQGTYVECCSKAIQWCRETYLLRGQRKRLEVEWTGTLVEFRHTYDDFDRFHSYCSCLEPRLSLY